MKTRPNFRWMASFVLILMCQFAYADDYTDWLTAENGFTEVTNEQALRQGDNVYYVLRDANNPALVLRADRFEEKPDWAPGGTRALRYTSASNTPVLDMNMYFQFAYRAGAGYAMKCVANPEHFFQTHDNAGFMWVNTFNETAVSEWDAITPAFADGAWTFAVNKFPQGGWWGSGNYLGPWTESIGVTEQMAIAANKTLQDASRFRIYSISKDDFNSLKNNMAMQPLYAATVDNPVNATYLAVNPSFETGDITGWTFEGADVGGEIGAKTYNLNEGEGKYCFNAYALWMPLGKISQEISIPAGIYDISGVVAAWDGRGVTFAVNGYQTTVTGQGDQQGVPVILNNVKVDDTKIANVSAVSTTDWWSPGQTDNEQNKQGFFKFDKLNIVCKGVYFSNLVTQQLPNDLTTVLQPNTWYYYDANALGNYRLEGKLDNFVYTQNGEQIVGNGIDYKQVQPSLTLNQGKVFFMTTDSDATLKVSSVTEEGASNSFTICTLNVDGLPQKISFYELNPDGPGQDGTRKISSYLASKGYDFIAVQEDFNYNSDLIQSLNQYATGSWRGGVSATAIFSAADTDGLNFFWNTSCGRNAFNESWTRWESCANTDGNQYIKKGYRHYEIQLTEGMIVDVYMMHMDAGDKDKATPSRNSQWTQLLNAVLANPNHNRPKIILGDTNSRYTREDIINNFILPINESGKYVAGDVWVEKVLFGAYPEVGANDAAGEVVDKVIYLNPTATNSMQIVPDWLRFETDYTYGTVDGSSDTTPLGDHAPLVVGFTVTQPAYELAELNDRWTWLPQQKISHTLVYLYNVAQGQSLHRGFLNSDGYLKNDPNDAFLWYLYGDLSATEENTSVSNGNYHIHMQGTGTTASVQNASSGATEMKIEDGNPTEGAYKFSWKYLGTTRFFNADGPDNEFSAATSKSAWNDWYIIHDDQKDMYDRYVAAWEKANKYMTFLPLQEDVRQNLLALLNNPTNWMEGTTQQLEEINAQIEAWFDDDKTEFIQNPSFELDANGQLQTTTTHAANYDVPSWEVPTDAAEAFIAYKNEGGDGWNRFFNNIDGDFIYNVWGGYPSEGFYCRQTISGLPEGFYKLTAVGCSDAGNIINLKMGSTRQANHVTAPRPEAIQLEVPLYYHNGEEDVVVEAYSGNWFAIDNFKLMRYDYYYDEAITSAEYATTAIRFNTVIPAGFEVLYATQIKAPANGQNTGDKVRESVILQKYGGSQLKAEEGVILYTKGQTATKQYRFYRTNDEVEPINGNLLLGTSKRIEPNEKQPDADYFMLAKKTITYDKVTYTDNPDDPEHPIKSVAEATEPVVGFFKLAENTAIKANKAYLVVNDDNAMLAKEAYLFSLGELDDDFPTNISQMPNSEDLKVKAIYSIDGRLQKHLRKGVNIIRMADGTTTKVFVR